MNTTENLQPLTISNPTILQFYGSNPQFEPESILLHYIDLLKSSATKSENINYNTKLGEIHQVVTENAVKQTELHNTILHFQNYFQSLQNQMNIIKSEVISDIQILFSNSTMENIKSTENLICQNINSLKDKIMNFILEQQPKHDATVINALRSNISESTSELKMQIMSSTSKDELQNVVNTLNDKFTPILQQVQEHFRQYENSSKKGKISETILLSVLSKSFPDADIIDTSKETSACDFRMSRSLKPEILFENKDYKRNVPLDEVKKFERDIANKDRCGVFISQNSGIAHKSHFQIDIINKHCVVVYIHKAEYASEYITLAVRIIDELQPRLIHCIQKNESVQITPEVLQAIAYDYTTFMQSRAKMIDEFKKFNKKFLNDLENMDFQNICHFLQINNCISSNTTNNTQQNNEFICNRCNRVFTSLKGLNVHNRKCNSAENKVGSEDSTMMDISHNTHNNTPIVTPNVTPNNTPIIPNSTNGHIDQYFDAIKTDLNTLP